MLTNRTTNRTTSLSDNWNDYQNFRITRGKHSRKVWSAQR
jgi:hypothetical protein